MESAISINALILWNEHISQAVNVQQANTHYNMTKIVRNFQHRKEHYTMHISFGTQLNSSPGQICISLAPETIGKPMVFQCFKGIQKWNIG